jgi:hypothetical protein
MSKANYNVLKDNKEFSKLSEESQKLLTNWMYKTTKD